MPFGAATLSAICPCPRELSRPDMRTATDTVRRNILTCANMQERLHYDKYSAGSSKRALPCRGRSESTAASLQAPQHAGTYDLPGPSQNAWPNSFQTSYGNTVSSPVIVRLLAPHATLTGQTGAVLAIFAVAALQAYVLAATIERIARKLLQAGGFVAMAAAFACLWLVPGRPPRCCRSCCCSCVEISALWSPRPPEPRIITAGVSRTGSVPRLTPPLRGQPFPAGCGVFSCLDLAPEQLIGLCQHQRVRAAELPDLVLDWQLGGGDLVLDVLAAGLGERPLQRALAAVGEEPAECAAQFAAAAAGPGDRPVVIGPGRAFADRGEPPLAFPCQLLERRAWSWPGRPQHR